MIIEDIIVNIVANKITAKLENICDKIEFDKFKKSLKSWAEHFEKDNPSTIIDTDRFYNYCSKSNAINSLLSRAIDTTKPEMDDTEFIKYLTNNAVKTIKSTHNDAHIIREIDPNIINRFFSGILNEINSFLEKHLSLRDKIILGSFLDKFRTMIDKTNLGSKHTIKDLTDKINNAYRREIQSCPSFLSENNIELIKEKVLNQSEDSLERLETNTLAASLLDAWQQNKHTVTLYGDGGMGKTVSLLSVHHVLQSQLIIYIPLRKVNCTADAPIIQYISQAYLSDNPDLIRLLIDLCEADMDNNEDQINTPGILLLLDGLNEVSDKRNIICEIENSWSRKKAVQTVISARYDASSEIENNNNPIMHLKIMEIDNAEVDKYLLDRGIPCVSDPKVRELLKIPLILNLYTNNETASRRMHMVSFTPRKNACAGAIIWNYLQYSVYKNIRQDPDLYIKSFVANVIAPYMAYQMFRQNQLYLSYDEMEKYIKEMLAISADCYPSIVRKARRGYPDARFKTMNFFEVLTKDLSLFHDIGMERFELYHQNIRDCLAALYIYYNNAILNDQFPSVWECVFKTNVKAFLSDMIQTEEETNDSNSTWDKIWQQIKDNPAHRPCHISDMIHLHKTAFGNDFHDVDFGCLDLTEVSLAGCDFADSKEHFQETKINFGMLADVGHFMKVSSVSWSQDGTKILTTSYDRFVYIYNIETSKSIIPSREHALYIRAAQWHPKDDTFVSAGDDKKLLLWNNINGIYKSELMGACDDWIMKIAWSPNGDCIICGDNSGNIRSFENNKTSFDFDKIHDKPIHQIIWSPIDEHEFATYAMDQKICIWHDHNKSPQYILNCPEEDEIISVFLMNTQKDLLLCSGKKARIIHLEQIDPCRIEYDITEMATKLEFSYHYQDVKYITASIENCVSYIALFSDNYAEIIHIKLDETGKYSLNVFASQRNDFLTLGHISCVQWNKKCNQIACGLNDGSVYLLDILENESTLNRINYRKILTSYNNTARCSGWSHNGEYLAVGYSDCKIRVWDWQKKRCLRVYEGHVDSVRSVAWSPDDKYIVSGSNDSTVKIWPWELTASTNHQDREFIDQHDKHKGPVNCVVWKDDMIISGSDDKKLIFWNRSNNKTPGRCKHDDKIYALSVSEDGRYLISGGNDKKICLWNISGMHYLDSRRFGDIGAIRGIAWGLGNNEIFFSSNDGHIYSLNAHLKDKELKGSKTILPVKHDSFVYCTAKTGNQYLISASADGYISILSLPTANKANMIQAHNNYIWNISTSPSIDNKYYIAISSSDGSVSIWDVTNPETDIPRIATLQVIPDIDITNCDFSGAIIDEEQLELIKMNGGIVKE